MSKLKFSEVTSTALPGLYFAFIKAVQASSEEQPSEQNWKLPILPPYSRS